jgi:hypothetical protein
MPLNDWQFWVVTILAILGLWLAKRAIWPGKRGGAGKKKRVQLTIEKRKP